MRKTAILTAILSLLLITNLDLQAQLKQDYQIKPIPFTEVQLQDEFWSKKIRTNHLVTIPLAIQKSKETGRIDNFKIAGGIQEGQFCSEYPFDDSDVYKIIEAASYSLQIFPDKKLEEDIDSLIYFIGLAQEEDGYLYTNRTIGKNVHEWAGTERWELVHELSHELYNLGHLYEAAVAYHRATGKHKLFNIARKSADLVCKTFGPGTNQIANVPGHQEIEIGLIKLYRITNEEKYLETAKFFLDMRGRRGVGNPKEYDQSHVPVAEQTKAVGHAVRGAYMWTAMADIAAITGDATYLKAIERIWQDIVNGKLYINGGIGATNEGEAFGEAYHLPNVTAYNETCAAIGNAFWNHRMFLATGDSKYIDILERSMYNNIMDGVSLNGKRFFYPNPLASFGQHERKEWFGCACCPPNVARFLPSMPEYIYAQSDTTVYVNLYVSSETTLEVAGKPLHIVQESEFPWQGKVNIKVTAEELVGVNLKLRVPGYVRNRPVPSDLYTYKNPDTLGFKMKINGQDYPYTIDDKGYIAIEHLWNNVNSIQFDFPFEAKQVMAHEMVAENKDKLAIERGPVLYCAEWPDNAYGKVHSLLLDDTESLKPKRSNVLFGTYILKGKAKMAAKSPRGNILLSKNNSFTLIPYHLWNNRGPGDMTVWLAADTSSVLPEPAPTLARRSEISASMDFRNLRSLADQRMPAHSNDRSIDFVQWPDTADVEWVQFDFPGAHEISKVKTHWFDNGPDGMSRVPESWKVQYRMGKEWRDVPTSEEYTVTKDDWDCIQFTTIKTNALRLLIHMPKDYSTGLYEVVIE